MCQISHRSVYNQAIREISERRISKTLTRLRPVLELSSQPLITNRHCFTLHLVDPPSRSVGTALVQQNSFL